MIADIVVDTNIFVHANNAGDLNRQRHSLEFLQALQASQTCLCVDEGFNYLDEAQNRSRIASEYLEHVRGGMYGQYLLQFLAATGRIVVVAKRVPRDVSRKISQQVPNRGDCVFVRVAHNSKGKSLVSHDQRDFPVRVRRMLRNDIGVECLHANAATPLVS